MLATVASSPRPPSVTGPAVAVVTAADTRLAAAVATARAPTRTRTATRTAGWAVRAHRRPARAHSRRGRARAAHSSTRSHWRRSARRAARQSPTTSVRPCSNCFVMLGCYLQFLTCRSSLLDVLYRSSRRASACARGCAAPPGCIGDPIAVPNDRVAAKAQPAVQERWLRLLQ